MTWRISKLCDLPVLRIPRECVRLVSFTISTWIHFYLNRLIHRSGVLTKPDTLSAGAISARQRWKQVLEGRLHPLQHGYYCVRLPDDDERSRNISRATSLHLATEFFESTAPWNEVDNRHRLGIPGFVSDISKLLISLIELAYVTSDNIAWTEPDFASSVCLS